jgi:hypothetical protein
MSANILASQVTKSERWTKLYRMIHHLFLKSEFIHIEDYNQMVKEMNTRIATIESKMNTELAKIQAGLASHIHMVPQAIAGTLPSLPPSAPPYTATPQPTNPVVPVTIAMERTDAMYMSMGPALAPLASGVAPDQLTANQTIISDIGI